MTKNIYYSCSVPPAEWIILGNVLG